MADQPQKPRNGEIREFKENRDLEVRYRYTDFGRYGEWWPVAWRVLGGRWRCCKRSLGSRVGLQPRRCFPGE